LNINNKKKKASKISLKTDYTKFIHNVNTIQDTINKIYSVYDFNSVILSDDKRYISKKNINIMR
jgi:hypothetical protein